MVFLDFHSKFNGYHILQNFACTSLTISIVPAQKQCLHSETTVFTTPSPMASNGKRWQVVGCAENENEIEVIIHHPCAIVARGKAGDDGDGGGRLKVTDGTLTGSGEVAVL